MKDLGALFVVVSGLPASGKTTLARNLSNALALPLLDKDDLLDALFESEGIGDSAWRNTLSRRADTELIRRASASAGAVIASWWRHPRSNSPSGTPTPWLTLLPGAILEVHCICDPHVAVARFISRRRHAGHLDERHVEAELLASFSLQASLGPVSVGQTIEIDTNAEPDVHSLMVRLKAARCS